MRHHTVWVHIDWFPKKSVGTRWQNKNCARTYMISLSHIGERPKGEKKLDDDARDYGNIILIHTANANVENAFDFRDKWRRTHNPYVDRCSSHTVAGVSATSNNVVESTRDDTSYAHKGDRKKNSSSAAHARNILRWRNWHELHFAANRNSGIE